MRLPRLTIAAMAAAFLMMGMVVAGYGPLLEYLTRRFGVSLPVAGATISVYFAGSLPGVIVAMRLFERLPARAIVAAAIGVAVVGLTAAALAAAWPLYLAGVLVIGFGYGALILGLNQLIAHSAARRRAALLNVLNGCYTAGAVVAPIVVAAFARNHFSMLYMGAALVWVAVIPGAARIPGRLPVAAGSPRRPSLLVGIFICANVLYGGIENGIGGWMTTHLVSVGLPFGTAALATSGFWLALVSGRLLITLAPERVTDSSVVLTGSALGTVALLAASVGVLAPFAYLAAGLALAPIFPTAFAWLARLSPGDSRATSWVFPAASIGGALGPGLIGVVIAGAGVAWAPTVLAVVALGMSAAFLAASTFRGRESGTAPRS